MDAQKKVLLFRRYFSGLENAYGTYDLKTGKVRVMNKRVTDQVIRNHIEGVRPYGVFLLVKDRTRAVAVDFDSLNPDLPIQFISRASHHGLPSFVERSKSKGYHVWMFFEEQGVLAWKPRRIVQMMLAEMEMSGVEVFPKQDRLDSCVRLGNFIHAPLFGKLVDQGRTVFVDPADRMNPFLDQWEFLKRLQSVPEKQLDAIIQVNELEIQNCESLKPVANNNFYSLPPCARKMLSQGVCENQRVACFRLAVNLKRVGIPLDLALVVLKSWALKNRPAEGKRIITEAEITSQTRYAYKKNYRGFGCSEPVIQSFCDDQCPLLKTSVKKMKPTVPDQFQKKGGRPVHSLLRSNKRR